LPNVRQLRCRLGWDAPISEAQAKRAAAEIMARADPERDLPGQGARTDLEPRDNVTKLKRGNEASYLAARLKRDFPDIAAAVERGEYPSMRKAALAAGIVKPPDPLRQAQRLWEKMLPEERDAFEDALIRIVSSFN
jgi:hypothetical protein